MKVLISDNLAPVGEQILKEAGLEVDVNTGLPPEELKKIIPAYDGLVIRSATKVREDIIEAATKLKVVGRAGIGLDNVDIPAATRRGVVVMNTPGQNSNAVAELALGMMVFLNRTGFTPAAGSELRGKKLGIHAYGAVGRIVGMIAKGFGMKVHAFDPYIDPVIIKNDGILILEKQSSQRNCD